MSRCIIENTVSWFFHKHNQFSYAVPKIASTNILGLNVCRSSIVSPTPINLTGMLCSLHIWNTTPPLAVPSNYVIIKPEISVTFENSSACIKAFCPTVPSRIKKVS